MWNHECTSVFLKPFAQDHLMFEFRWLKQLWVGCEGEIKWTYLWNDAPNRRQYHQLYNHDMILFIKTACAQRNPRRFLFFKFQRSFYKILHRGQWPRWSFRSKKFSSSTLSCSPSYLCERFQHQAVCYLAEIRWRSLLKRCADGPDYRSAMFVIVEKSRHSIFRVPKTISGANRFSYQQLRR